MTEKRALQLNDVNRLNSAIGDAFPMLDVDEVENVRSRLIDYIVNGLTNGYNLALVRVTDEDEINLKILKLIEENLENDDEISGEE